MDGDHDARPIRSVVGLVGLLAALLFGGMAAGLAMALTVGGGSVGAIVVGFLFLPLVFGLGMSAWRGIAMAWLTSRLLRALVRSRGDEAAFREAARGHLGTAGGGLPGTWVFLPVALILSAVAAVAMAALATGDRLTAAVVTLAVGVAYGVLLRRLARRGLLPLPEE